MFYMFYHIMQGERGMGMVEVLEGRATFYSHALQIDINSLQSVYDTGSRVGFLVCDPMKPDEWHDIHYDSDSWKAGIRNYIDLLHNMVGMKYRHELEPIERSIACDVCNGSGFWEDGDGAMLWCPACNPGWQ